MTGPGSRAGRGSAWMVQGMGRGKVPADWPPIEAEEVAAVLASYPGRVGVARVTWRSPRPMSAAALVDTPGGPVFVKRHHPAVRDAAALGEEHALVAHLRDHPSAAWQWAVGASAAVPAVLTTLDGATVVEHSGWVYEVHAPAPGVDAYRDVLSWEPYRFAAHARSAGRALAAFHLAAAGYEPGPRAEGVLRSADLLVRSGDLMAALDGLVARRPGLAAALARWPWQREVDEVVAPLVATAGPAVAGLPSQWGHGDWHPSNLGWSGGERQARVVGLIDVGLANRTSAVHDLAVALERSVIGWLDLEARGAAGVDLAATRALLGGYREVRPLTAGEAAALITLLPVVHVDFAVSEIEYFATVVRSPGNAELAYRGYLLGHARWFAESPAARSLLAEVQRATARLR